MNKEMQKRMTMMTAKWNEYEEHTKGKVKPVEFDSEIDRGLWCVFDEESEQPYYFKTKTEATQFIEQENITQFFIFKEGEE